MPVHFDANLITAPNKKKSEEDEQILRSGESFRPRDSVQSILHDKLYQTLGCLGNNTQKSRQTRYRKKNKIARGPLTQLS